MLLFLSGIGLDISSISIILILLLIFGLLIFYSTRAILKTTLHGASDRKINVLSRVCAFLLAPLLLAAAFILFLYIMFQKLPEKPVERDQTMTKTINEHLTARI